MQHKDINQIIAQLSLPIKEVKIANNLAKKMPDLLRNLGFADKKLLLVSDERIYKNCRKFFATNVEEFCSKSLIFKAVEAEEKYLQQIILAAKNCDLIIALGSGTVNDLCKLAAAKIGKNYVVFPSAPSMNGYLSRNASIKINGHKKTVVATLPLAVFCDLAILKAAPKKMIKAGIGDSLCFYSCWFDWLLSHLLLQTKFDQQCFAILQKRMDVLRKNYAEFSLEDEKFLLLLIEILLLSGLAMTMAGGSYSASQSEHMIAHCLEMKYGKKMPDVLHGQQIAITTMSSLQLQRQLLLTIKPQLQKALFPQKELENFFGKKITAECKKEYEIKSFSEKELAKINASLARNWQDHKKKLQKIFNAQKDIQKIFDHFKINNSIKSLGLSQQQYQEVVAYTKFTRNRFTCLDL